MTSYRYYAGHDGRIHKVPKTREEILSRWKFAGGFAGVCLLWIVCMALVSGIFA